jgi:hypothetical protein
VPVRCNSFHFGRGDCVCGEECSLARIKNSFTWFVVKRVSDLSYNMIMIIKVPIRLHVVSTARGHSHGHVQTLEKASMFIINWFWDILAQLGASAHLSPFFTTSLNTFHQAYSTKTLKFSFLASTMLVKPCVHSCPIPRRQSITFLADPAAYAEKR